jgi:hypothetical protein
MMARIKGDPNPPGVENFLFINALNEWGEGSCIEPSVQFGHGYVEAMRNAVQISAEKHVWQKQEMEQGRERIQQFNDKIDKNVTEVGLDVCVLIRTSDQHYGVSRFPLDKTLWSLQAQKTRNWRAVIFDPDNNAIDTVREMDPRFTQKALPESMSKADATEWIITHLAEVDEICASAKYMLIADAGNEYSSSAIGNAASSKADFVALNVESRATIRREHLKQDEICVRLMDVS